MKLSILFEALHPRLKATMAEINAEIAQGLAALKFTLDPNVELMYSAGGFPAGWNVGTLEIDGATYIIWANFGGQVGVATGHTPPNRWHTPEELITTLQRRIKREATFKAKPDANRLVSTLKRYGHLEFSYYRVPLDPAKPTYNEGWYKSSDAPWMGRGVIEYIKTHRPTPEAIEELKDSFSMTMLGWRWAKVQEKAGIILPEEPQSDDFHTDDDFSRNDNASLLVNKDTIALTSWQKEHQATTPVTWWPPEIMNALRQIWTDAKREFLEGIEKAKKE